MKIVAVGGGEIGRPGTSIETETIDKETIRLSGKEHPKLLFIPTASSDSEGYVEVVKQYFGTRLGCDVDVLYLLKNTPSTEEFRKKILGADIVYVGGGNTLKMMSLWRKLGVDLILKEASQKGVVLSGVSAGAICWFRYGNSDSRKFKNPEAPLIKVKCLNMLSALCCPHYDAEDDRTSSMKNMMKTTSGVAIALDNCAALVVVDDTYRVLSSKEGAGAFKVFWRKGEFHHERIIPAETFSPLDALI